jgi:hypothetical protein
MRPRQPLLPGWPFLQREGAIRWLKNNSRHSTALLPMRLYIHVRERERARKRNGDR